MRRNHSFRRRYPHHHGHGLFVACQQRSNYIRNAVTINISIVDIEYTVTITIEILIATGRIIVDIGNAIVVIIFIAAITNAITIGVDLLGRIVREGILTIRYAITVIISIRGVADTVAISIH